MKDWRWLWDDPDKGLWHRIVSLLLAPLEWGYRGAVGTRGWAYERGLLRSEVPAVPAVGVGNLTVGGTGKTPCAAWLSGELEARGRRPALVMRGYGGDEVQVHRVLNPEVPVVVSGNRMAGVSRAIARGADVVVLDDAFQHRALRAHAYIVLLAAEEWSDQRRLLPRGPWREPLEALERSTLTVITRKSASRARADDVRGRLAEGGPPGAVGQIHLRLSRIYRYTEEGGLTGDGVPLAGLRAPIGVAGVARPEAFWSQLAAAGTELGERVSFSDHHVYRQPDVSYILERAAGSGPIVATLKDAVKLRRVIPREIDIYVPLQEIEWEAGRDALDRLLEEVLAAGEGVGGGP